MNRSQIQAFLRSLVSDANDALAHLADDRYDLAAAAMTCAGPDVMNIVEGLRQLAEAQETERAIRHQRLRRR